MGTWRDAGFRVQEYNLSIVYSQKKFAEAGLTTVVQTRVTRSCSEGLDMLKKTTTADNVLCMYVYSHIHCNKSMDQLGKVANSARGQLNRGNEYFPVRVRA